ASSDALAPSVVISHRLSQRLFNGAREALGAHLVLNTHDYVVVGVAGSEWNVPSWNTDVWQSASFERVITPQCCYVQLLGRLKPGATLAQANDDVRGSARALERVDPRSFGRLHPSATILRNRQLGDARRALLLLWAAVAVVLVVACANLLNLLLARNLARTREIALRQALGASRGRLTLQGLTESALLFGRSLGDLLSTDLGVTPEHVTTATINAGIGRPHSGEDIASTMQRVVERMEQVPGVRAAGVGTSLPPDAGRLTMTLKRKGNDVDYAASAVSCTPGYLQALGIRLVEGRLFTE